MTPNCATSLMTVSTYLKEVSSSHQPPGEMEKHIRLLAEVAPDWLTIHPIRKDFYLKLQKMTELNTVVDKINSRLKEEERSWGGRCWLLPQWEAAVDSSLSETQWPLEELSTSSASLLCFQDSCCLIQFRRNIVCLDYFSPRLALEWLEWVSYLK